MHVALGDAVRRRRTQLGMSQEDLAHRCNFNRTYMGGVERGEINPSFAKLLKLADGLDMKLSRLIANVEDELDRRE